MGCIIKSSCLRRSCFHPVFRNALLIASRLNHVYVLGSNSRVMVFEFLRPIEYISTLCSFTYNAWLTQVSLSAWEVPYPTRLSPPQYHLEQGHTLHLCLLWVATCHLQTEAYLVTVTSDISWVHHLRLRTDHWGALYIYRAQGQTGAARSGP